MLQVLQAAHDDLGHNSFPRTYAAVKWIFYWKNIKENVQDHPKMCPVHMLCRKELVKFKNKLFHPPLSPMDFICMDLIGEFHPPTWCGHHFALTACCMLAGFTWCIPVKTKTAVEVVTAYKNHIYCTFAGNVKILINNGTEFKNKLFKKVIKELGNEMSIYSAPYRPQSNVKIEGLHRFLKACITKHIYNGLEWDELAPMATACYNFFPNCSARESAFFPDVLWLSSQQAQPYATPSKKVLPWWQRSTRSRSSEEYLPSSYPTASQQQREVHEETLQPKASGISSEARDLILMVNNIAKAFEPKYKKET